MKILIAVPTFESIYPDTFKAIYDLDPAGNDLSFEFIRGYDCATARNKIVQNTLDMGVDYVLMVDNDTVIPKDTIVSMTDDIRDVCLGYYAHRGEDNLYSGRTNVCRLYQPDGVKYFNYPLESEYTAAELLGLRDHGIYKLQIHGGGMGCAFISTDVFRRLEYPWYYWNLYTDKNRGMLSEDLYFCELCRKAKIPVYTDTRAGCGHIMRHCQLPE